MKNQNDNKQKPSIDETLEGLIADDELFLFDHDTFEKLPDILKDFTNKFKSSKDKSGALFTLITLLSGILPNYYTEYNRKKYSANLVGYLFGIAGSGKGILSTCKDIIYPIHLKKIRKYKESYKQYLEDKEANENLTPPKPTFLFTAGNSTKASLIDMIANNNERAIICETEADTLTSAMNQQHGDFSEILRCAAEHESISVSRKGDGFIEIQRPEITIALSGTPTQLRRLINGIENGLFSRCIYFELKSDSKFENKFYPADDGFSDTITYMSELMEFIYDEMQALDTCPLYFSLTKNQTLMLVTFFEKLRVEYHKIFNAKMDGVVFRLGLNTIRIMMILSILAIYDIDRSEIETINDNLICRNKEFFCALSMARILSENAIKAQEIIMKEATEHLAETPEEKKRQLELKAKAYRLFIENPALHPSDACRALNINPAKRRSTIKRWFDKWTKELAARQNED